MAEVAKKEKAKKEFSAYAPIKACIKCGAGMGEHKDRYSCGRCGYTEFKTHKVKEDKK